MKRNTSLVLAILAGLAFIFWIALKSQQAEEGTPTLAPANESGTTPIVQEGGRVGTLEDSREFVTRRASDRTPIQTGDDLYPSETTAGIDWLNRNGFPSSFELSQQSNRFSDVDEINIRDGATAPELLDLERLSNSQNEEVRKEALKKLNESAAFGSMFALEVLARAHTVAPNKNFVWSEAYYRASEIRGNWAVALRLRPRLTETEQLAADLTAQLILQNANKLRAQHGLPPLVYDARPGLEQTINALRAEIQILKQATAEERGN